MVAANRPRAERAVVRRFRSRDRQAAIALVDGRDPWRRLGYTTGDWRRLFSKPLRGREGWVIEIAGKVRGLALLRPRFLRGDYLELFAVAPGFHGGGLGRALLEAVEARVFARTRNLFVCVSDFNRGARRFYARGGYRRVGRIPDLLIRGSSELLLRKAAP